MTTWQKFGVTLLVVAVAAALITSCVLDSVPVKFLMIGILIGMTIPVWLYLLIGGDIYDNVANIFRRKVDMIANMDTMLEPFLTQHVSIGTRKRPSQRTGAAEPGSAVDATSSPDRGRKPSPPKQEPKAGPASRQKETWYHLSSELSKAGRCLYCEGSVPAPDDGVFAQHPKRDKKNKVVGVTLFGICFKHRAADLAEGLLVDKNNKAYTPTPEQTLQWNIEGSAGAEEREEEVITT